MRVEYLVARALDHRHEPQQNTRVFMEIGRILVAMSGGVDSSVVAGLLHEQGYDLVGVTMHLWDAEGEQKIGRCCAPEDREDAKKTCDILGIPHYVVDEREAFMDTVVRPFVQAYTTGTTPVPCVACNQHVKLTRLAQIADTWGATHIATGHYARLEREGGPERDPEKVRLLRGVDVHKDQSYFLYGVPQHVLRRLLCPLGPMLKEQVRQHAERLGLHNARKPDSQQLCFVPDGDIGGFVKQRVRMEQTAPGRVLDTNGKVLGTHDGVHQFTVGQRRGLGLAGGGSPKYVLRILADSGDVVVGSDDALKERRLQARDVVWTWQRPSEAFRANVRIRYRHDPSEAWVTPTDEGFEVQFDAPQRAVAPGQAAVVYRGDEVVAGGTIASA
jgi:tRNA-specific 2-thiouridylase